MDTSLYSKYGGFNQIRQIIEKFYDQVLDSETLGPHFANTNFDTMIDHQVNFISTIMGGPQSYTDNQLRVAHAHISISENDWSEVILILRQVFTDFEFERDDIDQLIHIITSKKSLIMGEDEIVMHKDFKLFNLLSIPIIVFSVENIRFFFANRFFSDLFNNIEPSSNLSLNNFVDQCFRVEVQTLINEHEGCHIFITEVIQKHHKMQYEFTLTYSDDQHHIIGHGQNITQLRKSQQLLVSSSTMLDKYSTDMHLLAHVDQLTNIANRRSLFSQYDELNSNTPNFQCAVSIIDIDHFKNCNDTYGHDFGDYVLRELTKHINKRIPSSCIFARLGGEEFCLLQKDMDANSFIIELNNILASLKELKLDTPDHTTFNIAFSAGVTASDRTFRSLDELLMKADKALYFAKENGRSRVVSYSSLLIDNNELIPKIKNA